MKTTHILHTIAVACLAMASCSKTEEADDRTNKKISPALAAVIDAEVVAEAKAINVIRNSVRAGDEVTVSGWVMGHVSPFVDGRSAFILGDPGVITACSERANDGCPTPWDACCDTPEDLKRGTVTIQVVDADGRVLKEGIEGVGGIEKLTKLLVTGTVAAHSTFENVVINATAIDIQP